MKFENVYKVSLSALLLTSLKVNGVQKFGLELRYATTIIEAIDLTSHQNNTKSNENNICHLSSEDQRQVCEDAVKTHYCQRNGFVLLGDKRQVEPEKYYKIIYGGCYNYEIPPQIELACRCPTLPPLYLKDGSIPRVVTVVIDGGTASALENSI